MKTNNLKIVKKSNRFSPFTINEKNEALFQELRSRGFYVQKIGQEDDTRYLIVSCESPSQPSSPTCGLWD